MTLQQSAKAVVGKDTRKVRMKPGLRKSKTPVQNTDCGEKVPSSLWLLSAIYPSSVSVFGSLDGRETEGTEKPEDKAYNSLRKLPRPVGHSGRLRP